jgi:hypothetical protein
MPLALTPNVRKFREDCLVHFLEEMTLHVAQLGKRNSVCMLPPWFPAGLDDWERIAKLAAVHEIGSDPYWEKETPVSAVRPSYSDVAQRIAQIARSTGKEGQMWIKNYHIVNGTEQAVYDATMASYEAGIRNIFAWSYLGSSYLSWLKCDHPERVWEIQCKALDLCQ